MRVLVSCCLLLAGVLCPFGASAQWSLVQGAVQEPGGCIRLTNTSQNQRGGAWHDCQLNLEADFDLEFTVNFGTTDADGADGIVFVLQPFGVGNNVIGSTGGSIGYENGPFNPSLAVEMDTWQNGFVGDPWYDHIALTSDGSIFHNVEGPVQAHSVLSNIETGQDFPFRVVWDADTQTLEVYFDGDLRLTYRATLRTPFLAATRSCIGGLWHPRGVPWATNSAFAWWKPTTPPTPSPSRLDLKGPGKCASATSWC